MSDLLEFKPVTVKHISNEVYPGTKVPKLTDKQISFAQKAFAKFLRSIAANGMKFDYNHMDGGFYVRDFRLDWNCGGEHEDELSQSTQDVWYDIVSDGGVDIANSKGLQELPLFGQYGDGFWVLEHLLNAKVSDNCKTMPY